MFEARTIEHKRHITRTRAISTCKRCFTLKRKCSKDKPSCKRCLGSKSDCEYFTAKQIKERIRLRTKVENEMNYKENVTTTKTLVATDTELEPHFRQLENSNFKLIVNSTGEYSKYFSVGFSPFADHSANISWVKNSFESPIDDILVFDFSTLIKPISSLKDIKAKVPKREISNYLVNHFFESIFPFIPIVDKQEFDLKYNEFWKNKSKFIDSNFLILMFSVFFCSSTNLLLLKICKHNNVNEKDENKNKNGNEREKLDYVNFRKDCFQCIENLKFKLKINKSPSLSSLISLCLILYVGTVNCHTVASEISSLVKYCQTFGLHRNICLNSNGLRNVVYSFIWYSDILNSFYTGFPPNMHPDFFESENNFPEKSNDLNILFALVRFYNANVWLQIILKINKIEKSTMLDYQNIETNYLNSIHIVNSLHHQILNTNHKNKKYLKWLVTESRLGTRKSAILMYALNFMINGEINKDSKKDLVVQSMLLVNESILKVVLGFKYSPNAIWFIRSSFPFQALFIILSHIQKFPHEKLNFASLDPEIEFTIDEELNIDYMNNDIRAVLVDEAIKVLKSLISIWPGVLIERYHRILKFRNHVLDNTQDSDGMVEAVFVTRRKENTAIASDFVLDEMLQYFSNEDNPGDYSVLNNFFDIFAYT